MVTCSRCIQKLSPCPTIQEYEYRAMYCSNCRRVYEVAPGSQIGYARLIDHGDELADENRVTD